MKKERTITVVPALKSKIQKAEEAVGQRLRVAAYARVSTEQDEQESSYEAQVVGVRWSVRRPRYYRHEHEKPREL